MADKQGSLIIDTHFGGQIFHIKAFGAAVDGVTDDTTAVQNAINAAQTAGGGEVFFPEGTCNITTVTIPGSNVHLRGVGNASVISGTGSGTGHVIAFDGTTAQTGNGIRKLFITAPSRTGGAAVYLNKQIEFVAKQLYIYEPYIGFYTINGIQNRYTNISIVDFAVDGFKIDGAGNSLEFLLHNVCNSTVTGANAGLNLLSCGNLNVDACQFLNANYGIFAVSTTGKPISSVDLNTVYCDHNLLVALFLLTTGGTIGRVSSLDCWFGSAGNSGVSIDEATGTIDDIYFGARCRFILNGFYGALVNAGTHVVFDHCIAAGNSAAVSNTYAGIAFAAGVSHFKVTNGTLRPTRQFPSNSQPAGVLVFPGASDFYHIVGNDCSGNLGVGVQDSGTGTNKLVYGNFN